MISAEELAMHVVSNFVTHSSQSHLSLSVQVSPASTACFARFSSAFPDRRTFRCRGCLARVRDVTISKWTC